MTHSIFLFQIREFLIVTKPNPSIDKAKPSVRRRRKAAGLEKKMPELLKEWPWVSSAFLLDEGVKTHRKEKKP